MLKIAETIDVALGFDRPYIGHAAATVVSILRATPHARFRFIILHVGVDAALQRRMESLAPSATFVWITISDEDLPAFPGHSSYLNRTVLFRLGLERLAPADCVRVIYLDADLVVAADLRGLWTKELRGRPVAAVRDGYVDPSAFASHWSLDDQGEYFNSGVLLMDLAKVREEGLFAKAIEFFAANAPNLPYPDQDALNWALWGKWRPLSWRWNQQGAPTAVRAARSSDGDGDEQGAPPCIYHFVGPKKPWDLDLWHPWAWLYWDNRLRAGPLRRLNGEPVPDTVRMIRFWLRWLKRKPKGAAALPYRLF
jgi:lipopolysaccharide biosynthesis glycosyltransferase